MLSYWRDPKDPDLGILEFVTPFMVREGYPTRTDLVVRWEEGTDGLAFEHEHFYRALAVYKLAALGGMFDRRYLTRNADIPMHPAMEGACPGAGLTHRAHHRRRGAAIVRQCYSPTPNLIASA